MFYFYMFGYFGRGDFIADKFNYFSCSLSSYVANSLILEGVFLLLESLDPVVLISAFCFEVASFTGTGFYILGS